MELVLGGLFLAGCVGAYFLIGEVFDYFFDKPTAEQARRQDEVRRRAQARDQIGGGPDGGAQL